MRGPIPMPDLPFYVMVVAPPAIEWGANMTVSTPQRDRTWPRPRSPEAPSAPRPPAPPVVDRLGGGEGNEVLTRLTAVVLVVLLVAEGITILSIEGLVQPHMFIGLVLIPPVALKLATTGYRFVRYYTGSAEYREKGPPQLILRLTAPILVLATLSLFASGVWLLSLGHSSDSVLTLHVTSAIVWVASFGIHLLLHGLDVLRSMGADWKQTLLRSTGGAGARALLLAASLGGGLALALALLGAITGWHGE